MLIIGESLNSSIPKTRALFEPFDEAGVRALIRAQKEAGAEVLDINTALCAEELPLLLRITALVREEGLVPMFDSPSEEVLTELLRSTKGPAFINSVTVTERHGILPLCARQIAEGRELSVVALPVGETVPRDTAERCANVKSLMETLESADIPRECIYVDLLVEALATDSSAAKRVVATLEYVNGAFPGAKTTCGLSNVSFGLPMRARLNAAFFAMLSSRALSSAILNVQNPEMRHAIAASALVMGEDEYCMNYLAVFRSLTEQ